MSDLFTFPGDGRTPLSSEDVEELIPTWISTRDDLNEAEQRNITAARRSWLRRSLNLAGLLDDHLLRRLHRDMFGDVWGWAGRYRRREMSVGIDPSRVAVAVRNLCDDAALWLGAAGRDPSQGLARFHHRLVQIHAFVDGNGRHARLATDLLAVATEQPMPTWSRGHDDAERRSRYLAALRAADERPDDLARLVDFMW